MGQFNPDLSLFIFLKYSSINMSYLTAISAVFSFKSILSCGVWTSAKVIAQFILICYSLYPVVSLTAFAFTPDCSSIVCFHGDSYFKCLKCKSASISILFNYFISKFHWPIGFSVDHLTLCQMFRQLLKFKFIFCSGCSHFLFALKKPKTFFRQKFDENHSWSNLLGL